MEDDAARPLLPLTIGDGSVGHAVGLTRNLLEIVAERAYAPGRPLVLGMRLPGPAGGQEVTLRAKSLGSRRRSDGRFAVRLRLVDLRREQRALLERALGSGEAL